MASPSAFGKRKQPARLKAPRRLQRREWRKRGAGRGPETGKTAAGVGEARHLRAGKHEVGGISLQSPVQSPALSAGQPVEQPGKADFFLPQGIAGQQGWPAAGRAHPAMEGVQAQHREAAFHQFGIVSLGGQFLLCVGGRAEGKGVAPPYPQPLSFGVGQRDVRTAAAEALFLREDGGGMHPLRRGRRPQRVTSGIDFHNRVFMFHLRPLPFRP